MNRNLDMIVFFFIQKQLQTEKVENVGDGLIEGLKETFVKLTIQPFNPKSFPEKRFAQIRVLPCP